jgi:DNA (cytosine-5)-methyltransferase 1
MSYHIVSLFSGIGGLEFGFHAQGHRTLLFCENDHAAQAVLAAQYPGIPIEPDVRVMKRLPTCDIVLAGFPCQDLSQAGKKVGIAGEKSGLVEHLFRLIRSARPRPRWIVVENVPYMLALDSGSAMAHLIARFEDMGYMWAYRVVDSRSFGTPQRRPRVLLIASRAEDPRRILFSSDEPPGELDGKPSVIDENAWYGFYWTEGSRGVGWAREAVPPIKGGSTIGIASPPAVWVPERDFVGTITLNDAERLQGFTAGWTQAVESAAGLSKNARWRLIGNAVNTGMSQWLSRQIDNQQPFRSDGSATSRTVRWPKAAWGTRGKVHSVDVSAWPARSTPVSLRSFLESPLKPLSERATLGFLSRAKRCTNIIYSNRFLESLRTHAETIRRG